MLFDEYINAHITLDWVTTDVAKATQIMLQFEEKEVTYTLVKRSDRWVFTFDTTNGKAMELINMVMGSPVPAILELKKFTKITKEDVAQAAQMSNLFGEVTNNIITKEGV